MLIALSIKYDQNEFIFCCYIQAIRILAILFLYIKPYLGPDIDIYLFLWIQHRCLTSPKLPSKTKKITQNLKDRFRYGIATKTAKSFKARGKELILIQLIVTLQHQYHFHSSPILY